MIPRRTFILAAALAPIASACKKEPRCAHCGMKLDPQSNWTTSLEGGGDDAFDTPKCALAAWRKGERQATGIVVVEYYDRARKSGKDVVFVIGSDVLGPMGNDFVPVAPDKADRFVKDHGGRKLALEAITASIAEDPK